MKKYDITITKEQFRKLEGLAYWIADTNYIRERFGDDDPELKKCRDTISMIFDELDAIKTPFLVQNVVIAFSENWRRYKEQYLQSYLHNRGIYTA